MFAASGMPHDSPENVATGLPGFGSSGKPATFQKDQMMAMSTLRFAAAIAAAYVLVATADAFGCPNCKDGVNTSDPAGLNVARGYFYSILFMLAMPFTLAGSFGAYVWREMRRQKRLGNSLPGAEPTVGSTQS
jgi:hypothetical protein